MKWLITGGCGFIGTALIGRLLSQGGHSIRVLDNQSSGTRDDLKLVTNFIETTCCSDDIEFQDVQLVTGDILEEHTALQVTKGADVIVHLAANTGVGPSVENPRVDMLANVVGTFNYLEAARQNQVSRFIYASSGASVGEVVPPIHEQLPAHPVSPYGASKLAGEGYCSAYNQTFGIETVTLRFGNVYGTGSIHKSSVVAKFIRCALNNEPLEIYGDGAQTRDFIYIDDLIDAVLLAATVPGIGGELFQIASSRETTVGEMAVELASALGNAGVSNVKLVNVGARLGDVKRNFSDTRKAKRQLGWQSKTNLSEGLAKTVAYFLEKHR